MPYEKQEFKNRTVDENGTILQEGTELRAEHLDHIEDGIITNEKAIEEVNKKIPTDYAPSNHNHDNKYAPKEHTHSQYLTEHQKLDDYAKKTELPTKTSQLTNDSDFVTKAVTDELSDEIVNLPNNDTLVNNVAEVVKNEVPLVKVIEQPDFANSVDDMTDTKKVYLMSDGYLYAYMKSVSDKILNEADFGVAQLSVNGLPYGTKKERIYTKVLSLEHTISVTIPSGYQMIVYFYNTDNPTETSTSANSSSLTGKTTWLNSGTNDITSVTCSTGTKDGATHCRIAFRIADVTDLTDYIGAFMENDVVTIKNAGSYAFMNTGIAYNQPNDYEDRIIALENAFGGIAYGTY